MQQSPAWVRLGAAVFAVAIGALLVSARFQASNDFHYQLALARDAVIMPLVEVVGERDTLLAQESTIQPEAQSH